MSAPYFGRINRAFIIWLYRLWKGDTPADSHEQDTRNEPGERQHLRPRDQPNYRATSQESARASTTDGSSRQAQEDYSGIEERSRTTASGNIPNGRMRERLNFITSLEEGHAEVVRRPSGDPNAIARAQGILTPSENNQEATTSGDRNVSGAPREDLIYILKKSESNRQIVWQVMRNAYHDGFSFKSVTAVVLLSSVLFGFFIVVTIASILSAKISSGRAAVSSSSECGIWWFDDDKGGEEAAYRDDLHKYWQEARSGQYARNCYNSALPSASPITCDSFYQQKIGFKTRRDQLCPFRSLGLCAKGEKGPFSAIEFDTGLIDASTIGVNAPVTHKLRRRTACSPLNMSSEYIKSIPIVDDTANANATAYEYYYGATKRAKYTFRTIGDSFNWLIPAYSVKYLPSSQAISMLMMKSTYISSSDSEYDYWLPRAELLPPPDGTVTIMFVRSAHIYHSTPSLDPIFLADTPISVEGDSEPVYYNSDPRARVLACVDRTELCSPDATICWSMTAPVPQGVPITSAYWMMKWSLERSTIYDSITWRLGSALIAQESISQSIASNRLHPRQWEIEAEQLFATSLARIQFDAMAIAIGEGKGRAGYQEVTPGEAKGQLCNLYKFRTVGYTNINFLALQLLFCVPLLTFVLSLEAHIVGLISNEENTSPKPLVIYMLLSKLFSFLKKTVLRCHVVFKSFFNRFQS